MFINPTIDTLAQRAQALRAILTDNGNELTLRQIVALQLEYDNIGAAMRAIRHPALKPAPAAYERNIGTLWAWYCNDARLHESHNALTLVAPISTEGATR